MILISIIRISFRTAYIVENDEMIRLVRLTLCVYLVLRARSGFGAHDLRVYGHLHMQFYLGRSQV